MADSEIVDLEEASGEFGSISSLCLVGKVLSPKTINVVVITNIIKNAWRTKAPVNVTSWMNNTFLFRFDDEDDKNSILKDNPWLVMNCLLVLKGLVDGVVVSKMDFSLCPFWVQIHGLPVEKMSRVNAEIIGRRFRRLLAIEASSGDILVDRSFLRVRVEINADQPLPKGFWLRRKGDSVSNLWISYKYEKLLDYCYACGRIGHDNRICRFVSKEEGMKSGYGPELRTGRARKSVGHIEEIGHKGNSEMNPAEVPIGRRPELRIDRAASEMEAPLERVRILSAQQNQPTFEKMRETHSPDDVSVLHLTGVTFSRAKGTTSGIAPILIPQGISKTDNSIIDNLPFYAHGLDSMDLILSNHKSSKKPVSPCSGRKVIKGGKCLKRVGRRSGTSGNLSNFESSLCEVNIQHNYESLEEGIGRTLTSQALGDMVRKNRPSIVFLMETKNNKVRFETIRRRLNFDFGSYVDPVGLAGGLALWWNNDVEIEVDLASKNLIHAIVSDKANSSNWAASFVYGCPMRSGREQVWEDLKDVARFEKLPWLCIGDFNEHLRSYWAASFAYGCPMRSGREQVWEDLKDVARFEKLPWLCIGDFNEVMSLEDKIGGNKPSQGRLSSFHDMLSTCGLVDLEFKGPKFTWRNNRADTDFIRERIDMAFANAKWRELYDQALVFGEAAIGSNHNPLILHTTFLLHKVGKPFRFESFWTTEEECRGIISEAWSKWWEGSKMVKVCKKLHGCQDKLKEWHRANFENLRFQIAITKEQLFDVQKQLDQGYNPDCIAFERVLTRRLEDLWQKDSMYWHQRSRIKWLHLGDKNSRFFHLTTIQRRQRNQIVKLKDGKGSWKEEPKDIANIIKKHFQSLYSAPLVRELEDIISLIDPIITQEMNSSLTKVVSSEEVRQAVFQMGPFKAPGLDSFPGLFYQTYWDIVGIEVVEAVQSFFLDGVILKEINHTNVTLIPKSNNQL
ncbi:hypothetical protein Vadar_011057 [Vaccinium darrowii]|uniref:Uncharacterized protein n=1 Tax=Vaccinium darrowii TaxID=229202 RepID=A0ACB7XPS9_9ERIC|nr:hypothetical protein Vadar_011057 [Vaccinium darrowii]